MMKTLRKISSIGLVGVLAGSLAAGLTFGEWKNSLPTDAGNYKIVVGADAKTADVVGAIEIASALQYIYKEKATPEDLKVVLEKGVTYENAVPLYTADQKLYLGDNIDKAIETVTDKDMAILEKGEIVDEDGNEYPYTQYIELKTTNKPQIVYVQPESGKEPVIALNIQNKNIYELEVIFQKAVDFTNSKLYGKTIKLFGKEFVISEDSDSQKLVLYAAAQEVSVKAGEETTVTIGDKTYTIKVEGVNSETHEATITVNGETKDVKEARSVKIGGLDLYVKDVWAYDVPEKAAGVTLLIGSNKYVFEDGQSVYVNDKEIKGTEVTLGGTPASLTSLKITVKGTSDKPLIVAGEEFTDPVFGTFKLVFKGPSIELTDNSRDKIEIAPYGDMRVYIRAPFISGETKDVYFGYYDTTWKLADYNGYAIHIKEGEDAKENELLVLYPDDSRYAHLVKVKRIYVDTGDNQADDYVEFEDVITGATYKTQVFNADNSLTTTLVVDGKSYTVDVTTGATPTVSVYYGTKDVNFPALKLKNGEEVYVHAASTSTTIHLSDENEDIVVTGPSGVNWAAEVWVDLDDDSTIEDNETFTVDSSSTTIDIPNHAANVDYTIKILKATHVGTYTFADSNTTTNDDDKTLVATPAVTIVEEKQVDGTQESWIFRADLNTDNKAIVVEEAEPLSVSWQATSADKVKKAIDKYGTYAVYDYTSQDRYTLYYPDNQVWYDIQLVPLGAKEVTETKEVTVGDEIDGWKVADIKVGTEEITVPKALPFVGVLDNELTTWDKIIAVGGPAVNKITAEVLNLPYPTYGGTLKEQGILSENEGLIKIVESDGKIAVLVFGWDADDTRAAAKALVRYIREGAEADKFDNAESVKVVKSETAAEGYEVIAG